MPPELLRKLAKNLAVLAVMAAAACGTPLYAPHARAAEPAGAIPIPVNTVKATSGRLAKIIAGIGTVAPLKSVTVRPRASAQVMSIGFEEGQFVTKGDLLMQLDTRELEALLRNATAKKEQDEAQLEAARRDADRYSSLAARTFVSAQTLDQKVAIAKQLGAAVAGDDATIANARTQLSYATLTAPITGVTGFKTVDVGALVAAGSTDIVTITQLDPIGIVFVAPGDRFEEIREALHNGIAVVEAWSTDGSRILSTGRLTLMDNFVDPANGSIRLRATFDNKAGLLWPGLPVATRLTTVVRAGVIVPDKALLRSPSGLFAYVLQPDGSVRRRPVATAFVTSGSASIETGLSEGDQVVTDGTSRIVDGSAVIATDTTPGWMAGLVLVGP